jgi:sialidase-1
MSILLLCAFALQAADGKDVVTIPVLPPSMNNPRNSEGDFLQLKDGLLIFVFTKFIGSKDSDHASAELAARYRGDGGRTWSLRDVQVLRNEGLQNVMSVSLLRLGEDEIGLFYLRKNSSTDCRMYLRRSADEAHTWSEAEPCIPDEGYFVVNNDRVVRLRSGRLVVPAARHASAGTAFTARAVAVCYLSDDGGRTWRRSASELEGPPESKSGLQEPLVAELKDGRLLMLARTDLGCAYRSHSSDGGETWAPAEATGLLSPLSPASVERIPSTGDLLIVWNDHRSVDPALKGRRTPLSVALSKDEGETWGPSKTLAGDPDGWYCYTAIEFVADRVLLAHCAGDPKVGRLNRTSITSFDVAWLYR